MDTKVIGITGGVGSGKSVVMDILREEYGAKIILADLVGHDLMEPGAVNYREIVKEFGTGILKEDQTIDRTALGAIVFSEESKLKRLNEITHPNIKKEIFSRIEEMKKDNSTPLVCLEAALLIEDNYQEFLDELWYVHVDEEIRIQRLMEGRGYTEEKCRQIMSQQMGEEQFFACCSRVIENNDSLEITRQNVRKAFEGLWS